MSADFMAKESRSKGSLGLGFYSRYLGAMQGIAWCGPFLLAIIIVENFFASAFRWLVAMWVEGCTGEVCAQKSSLETDLRNALYQGNAEHVLWFFAAFIVVGVLVRATSWTLVLAFLGNGGRQLHNAMVDSFARVRVTFFDENPTGRLVRRFSGDYSNLKGEIPNYLNDIIGCVAEITWIFVLVASQAPLASLACIPCGLIYFRVQRIFRPASREVQRLSKILETPLWSLFTETISGYQTIRAYGRSHEFSDRLSALYARYAHGFLTQSRFTRWLNVRLKFTSELFGLCITLFIASACAQGSMGVGTAGFLMSLTIGLDVTMQWLTRTLSLIESTMVSAERVMEYGNLPTEEPQLKNVENVEKSPKKLLVGDVWPQQIPRGLSLQFKNYSAGYRADLPLVVRNLTATLPAGQRIGVIGRTGAGKSSLFQALFRMLEVQNGSVCVDGIDLSTFNLESARSLFAIIPQEPHLFSGTLRYNLDRSRQFSDAAIEKALHAVRLYDFVQQLPGRLNFEVYERGSNLSVGQRQLLCMARAILTDAPVVLMDEPTASVDLETDFAIFEAARSVFAGRTVVVIAHRLETVHDCHLLLAMGNGTLLHAGPPAEVLAALKRERSEAGLRDTLSDVLV